PRTQPRRRCAVRGHRRPETPRRRSRSLRPAGLGLAVLGAGLVDRPRGPLLGLVLADAAVLVGLLDVLVLALALVAPGLRRHRSVSLVRSGGDWPTGSGRRPIEALIRRQRR